MGAMLLGAALAIPAMAAAQDRDRVFVVGRISNLISPDAPVGSRNAGLLCLPNGTIHWRDVALGENPDQREIVADVLEDSGLPVATMGLSVPAARQIRIRGIVKAAAFRLCAKRWGFGDRGALSGDVRLEVEWRADGAGDPVEGFRHRSLIDHHFDGRNARSLGAIYRTLLGEAAGDLARWLRNGRPAPAAP